MILQRLRIPPTLNKQLAIFMTLYLLLAAGWWFWLFLILVSAGLLAGHSR